LIDRLTKLEKYIKDRDQDFEALEEDEDKTKLLAKSNLQRIENLEILAQQ